MTPHNEYVEQLFRCHYCGTRYHWEKSNSWSLKMSFCSQAHERQFNGFAIEDIFAVKRNEPQSYQLVEVVGR